jgi:hypothetical protein
MDVAEEVRALAKLDGPKLRQRWQDLVGSAAPGVSPKLLRLALAYRIQADAYGDLSPAAKRHLAQIASGKSRTRPAGAGMRLVREWQGVTQIVTVDEAGAIRWKDREWKSLSAVARAITGGHWSGPAFFGLRKTLPAVREPDRNKGQQPDLHEARAGPTASSPQIDRQGRSAA